MISQDNSKIIIFIKFTPNKKIIVNKTKNGMMYMRESYYYN